MVAIVSILAAGVLALFWVKIRRKRKASQMGQA
jgi:hypothetical protein